jgi:hypothetical protein
MDRLNKELLAGGNMRSMWTGLEFAGGSVLARAASYEGEAQCRKSSM